MTDPIERVMSDLEYLTVRIECMERLAAMSAHTELDAFAALESIARECRYLVTRIGQTRKTLDPEIRS